MSLFAFILIALLSMSNARFRNGRFQRHRPRHRGQMGFKWSRKQHAKGMNVKHYPIHRQREEVPMKEEYTSSSHGLGSNDQNNNNYNPNDADIPEPTLNPETDNESEPVIIDNDIEPFTTMDNIEETDDHSPPIMDCLYNKCRDVFIECYNNEKCKEFMKDWQERQSLSYQCLPSSKNKIIDSNDEEPMVTEEGEFGFEDAENTDYPMNTEEDQDGNQDDDEDEDEDKCEYDELFWNTYHCGVDNYCCNDQLVLASSNKYVSSPSNYRVSPTNITGSKSSSFDYTLLMVAVTSGISAVILVEVLRRLYNGFKDKCKCKCLCNDSLRYLSNKLEQIRGYKYEKTHDDLTAIEEDDDDAIYGDNNGDNMLETGNNNVGVTYNGVINDNDSSISDDEELQKCPSSKQISIDHQQTDQNSDIQIEQQLEQNVDIKNKKGFNKKKRTKRYRTTN